MSCSRGRRHEREKARVFLRLDGDVERENEQVTWVVGKVNQRDHVRKMGCAFPSAEMIGHVDGLLVAASLLFFYYCFFLSLTDVCRKKNRREGKNL
jgi:hypothetical protein